MPMHKTNGPHITAGEDHIVKYSNLNFPMFSRYLIPFRQNNVDNLDLHI